MEATQTIFCPTCGKKSVKPSNQVNRANKAGLKIYCGRKCAGIGRQNGKTKTEKRREKAEYDKAYRAENISEIKRKKHEYFLKDYAEHPEKYRLMRQGQKQNHRKHINDPNYKKWKRSYDRLYRGKKEYGEFGEAAALLRELEDMLTAYGKQQIRFEKGLDNKTKKRKRLCKRNNKANQS